MTTQALFILLIAIIISDFIFDRWINHLNARAFDRPVPEFLRDIYNVEDYRKSQEYKRVNYRFSLVSSTFSFITMLLFLILGGFKYVDIWCRSITQNTIGVTLLFFGIILFFNSAISLPFKYYKTFVIEEHFGFNKMTKKLFVIDILKSWMLMALFGAILLALVVWIYQKLGDSFWVYSWLLISIFLMLINMLYTRLIVPLFNKQKPLEDGSLKEAIVKYAEKVKFKLDNIFVIDGSKRSTKANAYFSGFGRTKRINLYDTLLNDLEENEILSVLAHEVGHYKRKHTLFNMIFSILMTGIMLYVLSLCVSIPQFSYALGVETFSFHAGLITFGILYTPVSKLIEFVTNYISRVFEYQADNFAKETFGATDLISSLKKLSKNNLTNLTPHHFYVLVHYSHPPLSDRIANLKKNDHIFLHKKER